MDAFIDQLVEAHNEVIADMREKLKLFTAGPSMIDAFKAFASAIDWTEPLIVGLLSFHALLLFAVIILRQKQNFQATVFFTIMPVVYFAERLNSYLNRNWRTFTRQNYFSTDGQFLSALLSAPLLCVMFVILINYLLASASLLITMKRKELRHKGQMQARKKAK